MNLDNIAAGKLQHCRLAVLRSVRLHQHRRACGLRLGNCLAKACNLIAGRFTPVRIGKMAIADVDRHLAEIRFDPDSAVNVARPSDLYARRAGIIGEYAPVREAHEAADKGIDSVRRKIDPILGHRLKRA
jgi:hypothetical protein